MAQMKRLANTVWKIVLSPKTIVAFKVGGLVLQALHEIEAFRQSHKGHRVGFRTQGDDR